MAIAPVQSRSVAGLSLSFGVNVTAGNLLIVVAGDPTSATFTVSDSLGTSYTALARVDVGGGGSGQLFWGMVPSSNSNTVTITDSAGTPQLLIHEFSGVSSRDVFNSGTGIGNAQDSGSATTTIAVELLFGFVINTIVNGTTFTFGVGWTQAEKLGFISLTEYRIVAATGTFNATSSTTVGKAGSNVWLAEIATFSGPAAAAATGDYWLGARQYDSRLITPGVSN